MLRPRGFAPALTAIFLAALTSAVPLSTAQAAAALRITCEGPAVGAEVSVNGQFKGECPLDVQVAPGEVRIRAVKSEGKTKERVFEQTLRLGDAVVKRIEIELGPADWTPAGRKLEDERLRAEAERVAEAVAAWARPPAVGAAFATATSAPR